MNIAIVGSSGYISKFILQSFKSNKDINSIIKIDQTDDVDAYLNLVEPEKFNYDILNNVDFIIFTAAVSGPDKCALNFDLCWKINVIGTSYFIKEALKRKCKVLFFSSDAVYGNIDGMIYTEESPTQAETPYGKMKKAIEDTFKNNSFFKCIRLSYVASSQDRFISYCLQCIKEKQIAEIFHPFYRNCIVVSDVINVILWFIFHWNEYPHFVLNIAGKELVSRIRIADEINRIFSGQLNYKIVSPSPDFYKNRPQITQMKSLYLSQIIEDNTFTEKIQKELKPHTYNQMK